jgi:hypothetical protein
MDSLPSPAIVRAERSGSSPAFVAAVKRKTTPSKRK